MDAPSTPSNESHDGTIKDPPKEMGRKSMVLTKVEKEADLVMGTNNSSIVSKRSVELRYYPQYEFFRPFVKKPQRRAPLINRGYWLRMHAIAETVRQFLQRADTRPKFVLNLGCGYDPLSFQLLKTEQSTCSNVTFVDIDYEKLMGIKTSIIQQTEELKSILGDIKAYPDPNPVLLRASHYVAVGCDLKNLKKLEEALKEVLGPSPVSVLCIAEVSLTYMDVKSADALISWFPTLGKDIQFCVLEQFFPDGPDHPFASTMMKHFNKLQAPLHSIHKYPALSLQEQRFYSRGWRSASARTLWDIWNDDAFLSKSQRMGLDSIEPFDEWEEFALFASHYFLLTASTFEGGPFSTNELRSCSDLPRAPLKLVSHRAASFKGHRRFAAVVPDSDRSIGVHGGLGSQSRLLSTDLYCRGEDVTKPAGNLPTYKISARMCHTITALNNGNCLFVGGRASPSAGLSDCWIRKDNVWKPTDSLPSPRFRHCAVRVELNDNEGVLIYGGKTSKGDTLDDWLLWNEQEGWTAVEVAGQRAIASRFGAQMIAMDALSGYLFGGMSQDGIVFNDFWKWSLETDGDGIKTIQLTDLSEKLRNATNLADYVAGRFGATTSVVSNKLLVIGGIGVQGVLPETVEFLCFEVSELGQTEWSSSIVQTIDAKSESPALRPLLAGHISGTVGSSVIVVSGGAVCFSFGTFWNSYIWEICDVSAGTSEDWKFLQVAETRLPRAAADASRSKSCNKSTKPGAIKSIGRVTIQTAADFESILNQAQPVVITGLDIGACTEKWSKDYLVQTLGSDRKVVVHEAQSDHMNFQRKNFSYKTKDFGTFMDEIQQGSRQYLRSISSDQPAKKAALFEQDFPEIKDDFCLPSQLSFARDNTHSSPLRVSGPVTMWLHYDVMANVYCQIRGQKKLVLYPPSDVEHLQLPPGASSSTLDIFASDNNNVKNGRIVSVPRTSPHEATLSPGEILFIPPLWLHAAAPIEGVSIAINVFFRNLEKGYAAGRDVYANRDLEAYEKGRNEVEKIVRSFDGVPPDIAAFYLVRLAEELRECVSISRETS
ncbi:Leucine carboxyl methyltransferase family [Talaromyces stipitatus ATCC 10500]|uniref:tRNA wybutosine-synthesizing protein 4 n=1 Tax=Talaromyces stipitatus (strain ATCC 10500 / CBS 375.48 / QM 6759 / NRRL 1006) TaxID=441959 RepID=B8LY24_TALSN|nr:Leucine carboxyl methyltransferase family [Talaromyces stipitatus ATCC 10500]EED23269.1 Leucine carboxyl methyltransferase family [Talaromyces stipitatus ATCC 10500]